MNIIITESELIVLVIVKITLSDLNIKKKKRLNKRILKVDSRIVIGIGSKLFKSFKPTLVIPDGKIKSLQRMIIAIMKNKYEISDINFG